MNFFDSVKYYPPDPIFGLNDCFEMDPNTKKVNLTVGIYCDEHLYPKKLEVVEKAQKMAVDEGKKATYLPPIGLKKYIDAVGKLTLGEAFWEKHRERIFASQSVGGTGALRILADFLCKEVGKTVYVSDPTWPNHTMLFSTSGFHVGKYPYYDRKLHRLDFEKMFAFFDSIAPKSVVVLHGCCHNPTGCDLTKDEWKKLSDLFFKKELIPFFDFAYQGLGKGVDEDAEGVRLFAKEGHEMLIAVSNSKNFGLYDERVGLAIVIARDEKSAKMIHSAVRTCIRPNYSNPPRHGASTVANILSHPELSRKWEEEVSGMRKRINAMQELFASSLSAKSKERDFSFLKDRTGLFAYLGLSKEETDQLINQYSIYLPANGRTNVSCLNEKNVDYVIDSIVKVCGASH